MEPLGPGIYRDLPMEEYNALPWLRSSQLKAFHINPALYAYQRENPEEKAPTPDMIFGDALHLLLSDGGKEYRRQFPLEPDPTLGWKTESGTVSKSPRGTKAYKLACNEALAHAGARHLLSRDVDARVVACAESLRAHPYYFGSMETEVTIIWDHVTSKGEPIRCMMRPDAMNENGSLGEIKKTVKDPSNFGREFFDRAYWIQLGLYAIGFEAVTGVPVSAYFLGAVNSNPPHAREVIQFTPSDLDRFMGYVSSMLDQLAMCEDTDSWPAGSDEPLALTLEPWMKKRLNWLYGGNHGTE